MGFTPQQVNAMSLWQWAAAYEGYYEANADPKDKGSVLLTDAEFATASHAYDTFPDTLKD